MSLPLLITLLVIFLILSGFFSGSETALFSLSSMKIRAFLGSKDKKKALVARLLQNPRELIVTIIIVNVCMNILSQNVVSSIFGSSSSYLLTVGVPLALTLIFGEILPKSIGIANNERIAPIVAPVLKTVSIVITPLRKAITKGTEVISRVMFFFLKSKSAISLDELKVALNKSKHEGVILEDEAELIRGFLELDTALVKDFVRPRLEVLYFDLDDKLENLVSLFVDKECTRIPICKGDFDQISGVMTSKAFFLNQAKIAKSQDILPFLTQPFFVPETMPAKTLLSQMYENQMPLAIVVDEYGAPTGIISLEDLVEVIVGEIIDRRDETSLYTRSGKDIIIASGKLELTEFEKVFGIDLKGESHVVTIGGWLTLQLGDIPKAGVKFVTNDFLFHILGSDATKVKRVYIRRLKNKEEG